MDIVEYLVEQQNADITKRDKDGTCAALRAQWQGHQAIVNFFCQRGTIFLTGNDSQVVSKFSISFNSLTYVVFVEISVHFNMQG